ncbi:hypothetical protein [Rhodovulum sulfidophilum]|uniref:hypothetical protein n=1 Tax=Rhodovulum sulfidophilum TaxID=35806 RepID=UPI000951A608|nr:hypothetical protein [Rhodovulum sulfidophilum]MBL3554308.1 hypothetical protein [Rhodovulum sulfidophilum]OLS47142.1 hypothetical protein BV379_01830 [Rhodovulum sulfidophilum]
MSCLESHSETQDPSIVQQSHLAGETLVTCPVARERIEIYTQVLVPAGALPGRHRTVETTDLILRLVASARAVSATPDRLLQDEPDRRGIAPGSGLPRSIHPGLRTGERPEYFSGFIHLARRVRG